MAVGSYLQVGFAPSPLSGLSSCSSQVSRQALGLCWCCSSLVLGYGHFPKPVLVLKWPELFPDPCLHSTPDPGLGLCRPPSPARDPGLDLSSRPGPVQCGPCPCLESTSGPDWSAPLVPCQSSRPAPAVGLDPGPRRRGLGPCRRSSPGLEAGVAPCWPRGLEATHPLPPVLEAAWQWAGPWTLGPPHWPSHPMTSLSSWWLGNLLFPWKHSGGPRTFFYHKSSSSLEHLGLQIHHSEDTLNLSHRFFLVSAEQLDMVLHL